MSDYPATTLALNKGKYYVLLTIPKELRPFFNNRTQLKMSTGTSDNTAARQSQHVISSRLYAKLDAAKPSPLEVINDLLDYVGDAKEVQRLLDSGDLEGIIMARKYMEYTEDPEADGLIDSINDDASKALDILMQLKATKTTVSCHKISDATEDFFATTPYDVNKTARDAVLAIDEFKAAVGKPPFAADAKVRTDFSNADVRFTYLDGRSARYRTKASDQAAWNPLLAVDWHNH